MVFKEQLAALADKKIDPALGAQAAHQQRQQLSGDARARDADHQRARLERWNQPRGRESRSWPGRR